MTMVQVLRGMVSGMDFILILECWHLKWRYCWVFIFVRTYLSSVPGTVFVK